MYIISENFEKSKFYSLKALMSVAIINHQMYQELTCQHSFPISLDHRITDCIGSKPKCWCMENNCREIYHFDHLYHLKK